MNFKKIIFLFTLPIALIASCEAVQKKYYYKVKLSRDLTEKFSELLRENLRNTHVLYGEAKKRGRHNLEANEKRPFHITVSIPVEEKDGRYIVKGLIYDDNERPKYTSHQIDSPIIKIRKKNLIDLGNVARAVLWEDKGTYWLILEPENSELSIFQGERRIGFFTPTDDISNYLKHNAEKLELKLPNGASQPLVHNLHISLVCFRNVNKKQKERLQKLVYKLNKTLASERSINFKKVKITGQLPPESEIEVI